MALVKFSIFAAVVVLAAANPTSWKLSDNVEITPNENKNAIDRSDSFEETVEGYIKSHDASITLPYVGATVDMSTKNLDDGEFDLKIKFSNDGEVQARKKSKLKKVFVPLLVFILLKVMTIVPLAIGVLAMKAWNGLQLSFFAFIVSVSLAVFEMCKKLSYDATHPQIISNEPWKSQYAARSLAEEDAAQKMAYSSYL